MKGPVLVLALSVPILSAAAADGPSLTRGPYLQALLDTSVQILWLTDLPSPGRVECSSADGKVTVVSEEGAVTAHRLRLEGLAPGGRYSYRVLDGDRALAGDFGFRTSPPPGGGPIRVAALGDSGWPLAAPNSQAAVAKVIEGMEPDIVLHTGDLIYVGTIDQAVFAPYRRIYPSACLFPAYGNHADWTLPWRDLFVPHAENPEGTGTYYSFDWGSAHFAAVDTERSLDAGSPQILWLEADLEAARRKALPWTILYFHYPPFTVGAYSDPELDGSVILAREKLLPVIDRFEVDLVLNGHDHNYQRSHPVRDLVVRDAWQEDALVSPRGTVFVVTGGGGGFPYFEENLEADHRFTERFVGAFHAVRLDISASRIEVAAIAANGKIIDAFSIAKGGPRPPFRYLRGDADGNGAIEMTDALTILVYLFLGGGIDCPATADENGSGEPTMSDAIRILAFLFLGADPPADPFPACGPRPDDEDAFCYRTGCGG